MFVKAANRRWQAGGVKLPRKSLVLLFVSGLIEAWNGMLPSCVPHICYTNDETASSVEAGCAVRDVLVLCEGAEGVQLCPSKALCAAVWVIS